MFLGGRSNSNKAQAIGGVKGVNNYAFSFIRSDAITAVYQAPAELQAKLNESSLIEYKSTLAITRSYTTGINVRDGLRQNDTSGNALQFIYEDADCRLYYTPEMTVDATAMWRAAADAQWKDPSKCIGGNTYSSGSRVGKRVDQVQTSKLSSARVNMHSAQSLRQFEALEKSFSLETEYQPDVDGFMQP